MSAPNTNLEKQKRRHRGPLIGITVVTIGVVLLFIYWVSGEVASDPPRAADGVSAPASQVAPGVAPTTPPTTTRP